MSAPAAPTSPSRGEALLAIHFADPHLVVLDKPHGLPMHRGADRRARALLQVARDQLGGPVWLPHRLDRSTSGAVVIARSPEVHVALSAQFAAGSVEKAYFALVRGALAGAMTLERPVRARQSERPQEATSHIEALGTAGEPPLTAVRLRPVTGRRHQLRLHLRHLRHPIAGDTTYGCGATNRRVRAELGVHRLALHAAELSFEHPVSGARVHAISPLPPALTRAVEQLGLHGAIPDAWRASSR